jgi:hypothetical protein
MKIGLFLHACRRFWILSNLPVNKPYFEQLSSPSCFMNSKHYDHKFVDPQVRSLRYSRRHGRHHSWLVVSELAIIKLYCII